MSGPAHAAGSAVIRELADHWEYRESVKIKIASGQVFSGSRVYLWHPREDGFEVMFEDGRPFHRISFVAPDARHWCDPDQYDVRYDFADWPIWSSRWVVKGPRKDYAMTTRYSPQPTQNAGEVAPGFEVQRLE